MLRAERPPHPSRPPYPAACLTLWLAACAGVDPGASGRGGGGGMSGQAPSVRPGAGNPGGAAGAGAGSSGVASGAAAGAGGSGASAPGSGGAPSTAGSLSRRVVIEGLQSPWEISWGPDQRLWVTERSGKRVVRVNVTDGSRVEALSIAEAHQSSAQDGVLGMALHPELLQGRGADFVYVAYTYQHSSAGETLRRAKIRRYTYDPASQKLGAAQDVLVGLPASADHNSGRLVLGPDAKLYYSVGDQGSNQFELKCQPIRAQDLPSSAEVAAKDFSKYAGKILRLGLDGAVPEDNPLLAGARSHVFSFGHRNAQGLAFGPDGQLYASEQGPKSDDELNAISAGKNYGWPHVAGYRDDRGYVFGNWSAASSKPCNELGFSDYTIPHEVPQQTESSWAGDFVPPLKTFYTVAGDHDFQDPACSGSDFICWPTIAPSSLAVYLGGANGVPGWVPSLLVPSLKEGSVFRVALGNGQKLGEASAELKTTNRYRDVAVHPDQRTFYVATDNQGLTAAPGGGATSELEDPGAILEFKAR